MLGRLESPNDLRPLKRLVWIAFAILLLLIVAFAGYYYWDRYVHLGDMTPLQRNIQALEKKARENPDDPSTRLALAQYYLENKMISDAIDQASQIVKAFPDNDGAYFILGIAYTQSNQPQSALEPLIRFAEAHRSSEMAKVDSVLEASLFYLGMNYLKLSQPDEAIKVLTEALTIDRTDADAMYQLGLAYAQLQQHDKAIEQFQQAIKFVPDFAEAYTQLTKSYTAISQPDYAVYARGMEAYSQRNYSQARQDLETAVEKLPDFLPARLGLGLTYEQLQDIPDAILCYQEVLAIDPHNFSANQALTRIKQEDGVN
jgi:tetratricopeptide (TPR) repeat protein